MKHTPAFPCKMASHPVEVGSTKMVMVDHPGMTLRDWFAGMALQGMLSSPNLSNDYAHDVKALSAICYQVADGMLTARKEGSA